MELRTRPHVPALLLVARNWGLKQKGTEDEREALGQRCSAVTELELGGGTEVARANEIHSNMSNEVGCGTRIVYVHVCAHDICF